MPLYSFDPAAVDEDQDWECELLDGDKEQHVALRSEIHMKIQGYSTCDSPLDLPLSHLEEDMNAFKKNWRRSLDLGS